MLRQKKKIKHAAPKLSHWLHKRTAIDSATWSDHRTAIAEHIRISRSYSNDTHGSNVPTRRRDGQKERRILLTTAYAFCLQNEAAGCVPRSRHQIGPRSTTLSSIVLKGEFTFKSQQNNLFSVKISQIRFISRPIWLNLCMRDTGGHGPPHTSEFNYLYFDLDTKTLTAFD